MNYDFKSKCLISSFKGCNINFRSLATRQILKLNIIKDHSFPSSLIVHLVFFCILFNWYSCFISSTTTMYYKSYKTERLVAVGKGTHLISRASLRHFCAQCKNKVWGPTCSHSWKNNSQKEGVHKFSKIPQTTSKFMALKWWYETCSILRTCNSGLTCVTVIWCFLLGACELIPVTVPKKKFNSYAENIRRHCTKFSHLECVHPWHKARTHYVWHTQNLKYIQSFWALWTMKPHATAHIVVVLNRPYSILWTRVEEVKTKLLMQNMQTTGTILTL